MSKRNRTFDDFCHNYPGGFGVKYNENMPDKVPDTITHAGMNIPFLSPILASLAIVYLVFYYAYEHPYVYYILGAYLVTEILFVFVYQNKIRSLSTKELNRAPFSHEQYMYQIRRILKSTKCEDLLSGWFAGAKIEDIQKENVLDMIAGNFLSRRREDLTAKEEVTLNAVFDVIQEECSVKFKEGKSDKSLPYLFILEDINAWHHPLIMYAYAYLGDLVCSLILRFRGYKRGRQGCLNFWYLPKVEKEIIDDYENDSMTEDDHPPPFVFLHGIGIGLSTYTHFIQTLSCQNRITILIDLPWVALRMIEDIPPMSDVCDSIKDIMTLHGISETRPATCIGHSYGTFVLSALVKTHPEFVKTPVFVDPVCFSLYLHHVVENFVYLMPKRWISHDWLRYLVFSRDLFISNVLCRHLFWYEINMWPEEIPDNSIICLGGEDELSPNPIVRDTLIPYKDNLHVIYHPHLHHGEFLAHPYKMAELIELVKVVEVRK